MVVNEILGNGNYEIKFPKYSKYISRIKDILEKIFKIYLYKE